MSMQCSFYFIVLFKLLLFETVKTELNTLIIEELGMCYLFILITLAHYTLQSKSHFIYVQV